MAGQFVQSFTLVKKNYLVLKFNHIEGIITEAIVHKCNIDFA